MEIPEIWYVDDDLVDYPAADFTKIQDAVDAASPGDTIIVYPGTYTENVDVYKDHLTIQSENGAEATIIQAVNPNDHIFEVIADYVNINGFTMTGGVNNVAGMYLSSVEHCNISSNNVSDNWDGICLEDSSNNILTNNTVSWNNNEGIMLLDSSNNNTITDNTVNSNGWGGIRLGDDGDPSRDVTDNIVSGNTASNNGDDGIGLEWSEGNSVVSNTVASNGAEGISLYHSNNSVVANNTANNNGQNGIGGHNGVGLLDASNNILTNNTANSNDECGIYLTDSSNNTLTNNTVDSNDECGIYLTDSRNNTLRNNTMSGNPCNFFCFDGDELSHFIQDIDASNLVDGKPIYYWVNQHDSEIPNDAGFVALINCTNMTVRDLTLTHNVAGVLLVSSTYSRIENVTASNNYGGIGLLDSSNNMVSGSTCSNNDEVGIYVYQSNDNSITNNIIESSKGMDVINSSHNVISQNSACLNAGDGIWLWNSTYNTISNNEASGNTVHNGISLGASHSNTLIDNVASANHDNGINLYEGSTGNELIHNTLQENNAHGIGVDSSPGNVIMQNTVSSNNCGIGIYKSSSNNLIYLNSFSNDCNVCSDEQSSNIWDSPEEITYSYGGNTHTNYLGNYWSDYAGSDANGDGIGETPYPIDSDADNYPLVDPFENYEIVTETTEVTISPPSQEVTCGDSFSVNLIVDPKVAIAGVQFDLSFDSSLITVVSVEEGNLLNQSGASTYFSPGTIDNGIGTITGVAGSITTPGETVSSPGTFAVINFTAKDAQGTSPLDLSNVIVSDINGNPVTITVSGGNVTIGKTGDVNNDDHVNVLDMVLIGQHWGQTGSPGWIPEDVKEDGVINVLDMIIIGQHWTG